jgi:hypothetical protein
LTYSLAKVVTLQKNVLQQCRIHADIETVVAKIFRPDGFRTRNLILLSFTYHQGYISSTQMVSVVQADPISPDGPFNVLYKEPKYENILCTITYHIGIAFICVST